MQVGGASNLEHSGAIGTSFRRAEKAATSAARAMAANGGPPGRCTSSRERGLAPLDPHDKQVHGVMQAFNVRIARPSVARHGALIPANGIDEQTGDAPECDETLGVIAREVDPERAVPAVRP